LHWLFYVIWHPEAGVLWCLAGPLVTDLSPGVPSLSCAVLSSAYSLLTHSTVLFYLSVCRCAYTVRHAAVSSTLLQQCCELVSFVCASNIMLVTLKCCCCNQHSSQECSKG
jgi:hypothetical protein